LIENEIKSKSYIAFSFEEERNHSKKVFLIDNLRLRVNYIHLFAHHLKVNCFDLFSLRKEK